MDWASRFGGYLYVFGGLMDWGYWIASGLPGGSWSVQSDFIGGWFLAWFWPLHAAVEFWKWVL